MLFHLIHFNNKNYSLGDDLYKEKLT